MSRHYYSDVATTTTLTVGVSSSATSLVVGSVAGYPAAFPFYLAIDRGAVTMEVVDVTAAAGTTLTVTRGVGDTSPVAHSAAATVEHVAPGEFYDNTEIHTNATTGIHGVAGALGDASTNTVTTVDGEAAVFSGTGGKTLKRATGSGLAKLTAGVLGVGVAGTDYQAASAVLTGLVALPGGQGLMVQTGVTTFIKRALVAGSTKVTVTNGDGAAGNPTVDVDPDIIGQATRIYVNKAADEIVTASTTFQNDNHFAAINIPAGTTWLCELILDIIASTTGNFKALWAAPTGTATIVARHIYGNPAAATGGAAAYTESSSQSRAYSSSVSNNADTAINTSYREVLKVTGGGSGGTITFQWAQNTAAGTTTVGANSSWFTARRVA